ncbi:unnamed protein product, partial [Choristocarpus tenellus]
VGVVVGPVVGRVGPTSAVVLMEVDRRGHVEVVLVDTLTARAHKVRKRLPGQCPRTFEFKHLAPGRRYLIRLRGV